MTYVVELNIRQVLMAYISVTKCDKYNTQQKMQQKIQVNVPDPAIEFSEPSVLKILLSPSIFTDCVKLLTHLVSIPKKKKHWWTSDLIE